MNTIMNEAELEARITEAIRTIFPAFALGRIRHQKILKLKLGHREIKVNGTKSKDSQGRLDILLELDGKPLAILELKKPGENLDVAVSKQGLSYARLINESSIPPFVITSNGAETRFFRTWDGTGWNPQNLDEKALQNLFAQAGNVAADSLDRAVQHILEKVPESWGEVLQNFTNQQLNALTGTVNDLNKPISSNFAIARTATLRILLALVKGDNKIALIGEPLSGKTNVLAALCRMPVPDFCFLYIDLASSSEGIFDRIAAEFVKEYFHAFTKDHVKAWILEQLRRSKKQRLVVVVDGIDSVELQLVKQDLDTLASMETSNSISLVLAAHENAIDALAFVKGRKTPTTIGLELSVLRLGPLADDEFVKVQETLFSGHKAVFDRGADRVLELRQPRLLKLLVSQLDGKSSHSDQESSDQNIKVIFSIPNPRWFYQFWVRFSTDEVREGYCRLGEAMLIDSKEYKNFADILRFIGFAALRIETVEKLVPPEYRKWLIERGYLQLVYRSNGLRCYLPKIPELLMVAVSDVIAQKAISQFPGNDLKGITDYILSETRYLPYSPIVTALAVLRISQNEQYQLTMAYAVSDLLGRRPIRQKISRDAKFATLAPDGTPFTIDLSQIAIPEDDSGTSSETEYWLTAAYLLTQPLKSEGQPGEARILAIATIGSYPHPLFAVPPQTRMGELQIEVWELPVGISLLSGSSAFLEPVIELIRIAITEHQPELRVLVDQAIEDLDFPLLYRLYIAVGSMLEISNTNESEYVNQLFPEIEKGLLDAFEKILRSSKSPIP